jgi:hypothetical protein
MISIFVAGVLLGACLMAMFENSVWMQTRRVMYDMDRRGRERFADIKARELADINASRIAHGLEPVRRK